MQHFAFAVVILWLTSTLATMVIQGGRLASTRGAGLQMIVLTLAAPLLLLVSTFVEARAVNPDDFTLAQSTILLTAIGLAGLFAAFPFQGWAAAMIANAQPGVVAFLVSGYQMVALLLALNLFHDQPWLAADGQVLSWLAWGGWLAAAIGGTLAAVQRHFAPLLGYTLLNDLGVGIIALAMPGETGLSIAFLMAVARPVGALLAGAGLAVVRQRVGRTAFSHLNGLGHRLPLASAGLLLGGFSLSGLPLTAGFAGRWALLGQVAPGGGPRLWVLLFANLGVAFGWLRGARALFTPGPVSHEAATSLRPTPLAACVIVVALGAICLWIGRRPAPLLLWLRPLVETYTPLIAVPASAALP
jgi:formate hydrogenlyase subunit 3/multisubunit Na+/H+ antiporter MnhD subunit